METNLSNFREHLGLILGSPGRSVMHDLGGKLANFQGQPRKWRNEEKILAVTNNAFCFQAYRLQNSFGVSK